MKLLNSSRFTGVAQCLSAMTLALKGRTPSPDTSCPRYSTSLRNRKHFLALSFRLARRSLTKTCSSFTRAPAHVLSNAIMSSIYTPTTVFLLDEQDRRSPGQLTDLDLSLEEKLRELTLYLIFLLEASSSWRLLDRPTDASINRMGSSVSSTYFAASSGKAVLIID